MIQENKLQSNVIDILRFPLMVAVVFIHTDLLNFRFGNNLIPETVHIFPYIFNLISGGICRVAVPLFFFVSGYLFFGGYKPGQHINYNQKFKRRFHSLLVPYILWNTLYLGIFAIGQLLFPSLLSGNNKLISDYSVLNYLQVYWNIIGGLFPLNGPFWFLRDLIIVSLFSPIIHLLIKYTKGLIVLFLLILWLFNIGTVGTLGVIRIDGFLFFSMGAWLSINQKPFALELNKKALVFLTVIFTISIFGNLYNSIFIKAIILSGIVFIPACILYINKNHQIKIDKRISSTNFFIYAFHGLPLTLFGKLITKGFNFQYDWQFIILYFTLAISVVLIGILLYRLLEKTIPTVLYIFIGKRNK